MNQAAENNAGDQQGASRDPEPHQGLPIEFFAIYAVFVAALMGCAIYVRAIQVRLAEPLSAAEIAAISGGTCLFSELSADIERGVVVTGNHKEAAEERCAERRHSQNLRETASQQSAAQNAGRHP